MLEPNRSRAGCIVVGGTGATCMVLVLFPALMLTADRQLLIVAHLAACLIGLRTVGVVAEQFKHAPPRPPTRPELPDVTR